MKDTSLFDKSIFVLILTGLSYGVASYFETGYKNYYHIPQMFIELNPTTIVKPAIFILFILSIIILIFEDIGFNKVKNYNTYLIFMFIAAILFSYWMGSITAKQKENYMILKQHDNYFVVLDMYKDKTVIAPVDLSTDTITPSFQLIEFKSEDNKAYIGEVIRFENGLKVKDIKVKSDLLND